MDWRGVRVLVTGASGFIGSRLVNRLVEQGARVTRVVSPRVETSSSRAVMSNCETWFGSTRDSGLVERLMTRHRIEVCFHLGAISQVGRAAAIPVATFEDNVQGTWTLLDACRRQRTLTSFVLASSDKVYGDQGDRICDEETPLAAASTYDASKACADTITRTYAREYGLPTIVGRFCNVYGPGDRNLERLVPKTALRALSGEPPLIHAGSADHVREFLYLDDAVRALLLLAEHANSRAGEAFNVGSGEWITVRDAVVTVARSAQSPAAPIEGPPPAFREIRCQRLDSRRFRDLGWSPSRSFNQGVPETVDWYRAQYDRPEPS